MKHITRLLTAAKPWSQHSFQRRCMSTLDRNLSTQVSPQRETFDEKESSIDQVQDTILTEPLKHQDYFGVRNLFTLQDLFDANVHMGHKNGILNEHMKPFIFGTRLGMDILDLDKSVPLLQDALNFAAHIAYREGVILFLTRHKQMIPLVERTAIECGEYAHCQYWKLGTLTNSSIQYGLVTRMPDLMIFINTHDSVFEQNTAVIEAAKLSIPTIGILDSSCDPRLITYPVPGNDDTPASIELYCRLFKEAILKGKAKRKEIEPSTEV